MTTNYNQPVIPHNNEITENDIILLWLQSTIPLPGNNWVIKWWKNEINSGQRTVEGFIKFLQSKSIFPIAKDHGLYTPHELTQDASIPVNLYTDIQIGRAHV